MRLKLISHTAQDKWFISHTNFIMIVTFRGYLLFLEHILAYFSVEPITKRRHGSMYCFSFFF